LKIAHIGPPVARHGGPAGYLWQLRAAAAASERSDHEVIFPEGAVSASSPRRSLREWTFVTAGRAKRAVFGRPVQYRPSRSDVARPGGAIDAMLRAATDGAAAEAADSIDRAMAEEADVLFAHDPCVAERLLERRRDGQQIWLMLHSPMPVALYLAWSWSLPEWAWTEIVALPDVQHWMRWERDVCSRVDRLISPCSEAIGELVRADAGFANLPAPDYLLTGASGASQMLAASERARLRKRWGLPSDAPVGLFLGNAQPYRGLDVLLNAVRLLPDSTTGVIAVAGPPTETLPSQRRLRALGPVREVGDLLRAVDFVVNVNRFTLFDLSTIEAAEAGLPMLLHAVGGNLRFMSLGVGAVVVPELDPRAVADALITMFMLPDDDRRALGIASRQCYERHLTPAHLWQRHEALYNAAVRREPSRVKTPA